MRTATSVGTFVVAAVVTLLATAATGAEFSERLEADLKGVQGSDYVSAILLLPNAVDIRALDVQLHEEKATPADRHETVIEALKHNAELTQPKMISELEAAKARGEVEGFTAYWIENLIVVSATKDYIESFRSRGDVSFVTENFQAELIEPIGPRRNQGTRPLPGTLDETTTDGQNAIGATQVNRELGITGLGVLVANLDTGVDGNHPALASRWRGNTAPAEQAWLDVLSTSTFPQDGDAHGTHVMGTITGREISGGDTTTVGAAPDAEWIACNAIGQGVGSGFDNDVVAAYQWFIDPDEDPETMEDVPDVVQNSWGVADFFPGYDECDDRWNTFILNLEAAGTVVTWSAGNEGPSPSTLRTPANYSFSALQIFSVGAVSVLDPNAPTYDIAGFSSRGPTPCADAQPDDIKPEISAPGVDVFSSVPGGGYESFGWSGTSMAGPHVAGVVALMRQACPSCDPITIKEALLQSALDAGATGEDNVYGHGVVDAYEAVTLVSSLGWIEGTVMSEGEPLPNARVELLDQDTEVLTDADGYYLIATDEGTYDVRFSKFGYVEHIENTVDAIEGDTTTVNVTLPVSATATLSGQVLSADYLPVEGATVEVLNYPVEPVITDAAGEYMMTLPVGFTYELRAGDESGIFSLHTITLTESATHTFIFPAIFECFDFETAQGWTAGAIGDDAEAGIWSRGVPLATFNNGQIVQPGNDHTPDPGEQCWATAGQDPNLTSSDVDNGRTTLLSPVWDLSEEADVLLSIWSWYSNDEGANPGDDFLEIDVSADGGGVWVSLLSTNDNWEEWRQDFFSLSQYIALTDQVQVRIVASDEVPGSLVEAAVDDVCLYTASPGLAPPADLTAVRNANGDIELRWEAVQGATSYRIFYGYNYPVTEQNGVVVGMTSETSYVDVGATNFSRGHYYVVAIP